MNPFPDRVCFSISFPGVPESVRGVWLAIEGFLIKNRCLPKKIRASQIAGHTEKYHTIERLILTASEIGDLISERRLDGFWVDTGHSARSVAFSLLHAKESGRQSTLNCRIEQLAKAPNDWSGLVEDVAKSWPTIGSWQWRHRYQVWQWAAELHRCGLYELSFGSLPPGYKRSILKSIDGIGPDREFIDISLNPGRPKELLPGVSFYPTAEMWLGPHFWQHAKCTKQDVLAADFFLEKLDTPHFLYLKSWPTAFTRPDGEQGCIQQKLWRLLFREDCEWPPGSGGICDEPMYGPPELMPGYQPPPT